MRLGLAAGPPRSLSHRNLKVGALFRPVLPGRSFSLGGASRGMNVTRDGACSLGLTPSRSCVQ
jgi:hypothetical protein